VAVKNEAHLKALALRADELQLPHHTVCDAGATQIAANSLTVLAVLGPASVLDAQLTGNLPLLG
jgi:peptidyl-tRNA hydrolase